MTHTISVRVTKELALWLGQLSAKTGLPKDGIIRGQFENGAPRWRLAGKVEDPPNPSERKGFSRS